MLSMGNAPLIVNNITDLSYVSLNEGPNGTLGRYTLIGDCD